MGKEVLTFADIEIKESKFYCHKTPLGGCLVKLISFGEKNYKYFIGYIKLSHYV